MKKIYTAVIAIICCFGWVSDVRASHAQGADLTYRFISYNPGTGQSTYEVTATEYRDCTGIPADASMTLNVTNTGCAGGSYSTNFNMPMINGLPCPYGGVSTSGSGCEVSQLCPADLSQSTCSGGTFPGVQKYVYRTTITLPGNGTAANLCNQWLLSITISARNPSSNLATTGNLYIESLINNTIDPTTSLPYVNSSVTFGYDPVPFVCDTFPISYNNGAVDANGDSLVFQLITPLQGHNNPLSFNFGYTQNRPIIVRNNLFAFDVASGQIDFTPGQTDVDVLAIRVLEYRNGVLVGSVIRDVQVKILNCNVPAAIQFPISNTNNANPLDTVSLQLCPGTTASWDIQMASANGAAIVILSNLLGNPSPLPGATLTTVTTTPSLKTAHITWTPQISDTGCHYYQLTTNTQDCPVEGNFTKSYRVCVYNKVTVSPHEAIYCGTPIQLAATGGTNSTWAPTTGLTFPTGLFTPLAAPSVTTRYTFTSDCGTDTSLIIFNPPFTMDAGPGGSICQNGALQLNASVDNLYAPYQILWTPSADLTDPVSHAQTDSILNPIASPSVTTTYTVQFTANTGCVRTDTVKVVVNGHAPALQASADPTSICPGQQTQLRVTANPDCGLATIPCTGNSTPIIVGTGNTNQGGSQSLYPSPYGNYYKSARHQYLFHANEISSMLGSGGQISQIALYIGTLNQGSTLTNFTIRMGCVPTTIDSLDGYVNDTYLSTVYVFDYTPVAGWNNHVLQTPYNWDGVSNLVVDVCFHNTPSNNINNKMKYTVTPFKSVWCTYGNAPAGQCGFTGSQQGIATTYASLFQRPNFRFTFCTTPVDSPHLVWTSSTGIAPVPPSGSATPIGSPLDQTTYHVTLTDTNGCTSTDYVTVYVDTSNRFKLDPDTFICSISPVQLHAKATGNTNPDSLTYTWTSNPPGTAPISGKGLIRANPIVTPTVTTLYTCVITGGGLGCILSDTARVTIGNNIPVNKVVDSITCAGNDGRIIINMNAGTSPYTYTWSPAVAGNPSTISNLGPNTYYLTVVDNIGCSGHDTTTLIAPVPLALTLDSTDVACFGAATGTVTAIVTGGRAPYRYTWSPAQSNTNTLTGLLAGTYRLTVTDTSGCTITGQIIVNQPPVLTSYAIKTNLTGAGTNDGTVKVHQTGGTGPYTYTWTPPVVGNVDTACCLSAGTYIIRVCDSKGCCVQDTAIITVPPPINVVFTLGNVSCFGVCDGSASAVATGGVQPYTYAWSTTPVSNNDTILNICAGSYTLTVTDSNGITVSNTIVIVSPTPIDIAIDSTPITCFGANNGALDATPSGGTPGYTVNWSAGADPLTGLSPGMYIVTVTDAANCVAKDTAYLGQPTQVVATIASTDSVKCFGQSNGVARVSATGGRPPYTYLWTGSASVVDSATDVAAGPFSVTVTDASGCTGSVSGTMGQPLQILVSVTKTPAHCATSNDGTASAAVSNGTPPYSYTWDGTLGNPTISGLAAGPHNVVVADVNGCSTQQAFTIDTLYVLHISLVADSANCHSGNDGQVTVTVSNGTPAYDFQWSDGVNSGNNPAVDLMAGVYTTTVTDAYLCVAIDSAEVYEPSEIVVIPTFTNPLCTGDANGKIWLSASGGHGPPYTYVFTNDLSVHQMTDTITGLVENVPNTPNDLYKFTLTDTRGCEQKIAVTLTDPPLLQISDQVTPITCANANNGAISVSASGGTPAYVFSWSNGGAPDATRDNLGPGTYTISVTDANGCVKDITEILVAPPLITVTSLITDSTNCPGSADGHIFITVSGGTPGTTGAPYQYSIDDSTWQDDPNFYNLTAGNYNVYARDAQGCILQTTTTIFEPLALTLAINPQDTTVIVGTSMQLTALIGNLTTQNLNAYSWSPATGLSCIDCPNPVATPYETTRYTLVINYGKNCYVNASATLNTDHGPDTYIPNAFTPNGDEVNDVFSVFGTKIKSVTMRVFNRWGEKVFDSMTSQWASWDGTYQGVAQPTAVYVYVVDIVYLDGVKKTREGSVTLIR